MQSPAIIQAMARDMLVYRNQLDGLGASMYALGMIRECSQDETYTAEEFRAHVGEILAALKIAQTR